ncbi:Zinc ribbon domain protein [Candidatus Methanoperedenaceae archaeon GB37]|nr:Zinc ribbon domain protein [Candidatus Methanoperedenaceae archaeon GB37]
MPTYTYQCHSCAYLFEKEQKITDPPLTTCPKCGGPVKRVITGGLGFILKGSGFYATDYKRKSTPQKEKMDVVVRLILVVIPSDVAKSTRFFQDNQ